MSDCLTAAAIEGMAADSLTADEKDRAVDHLAGCERCRLEVDAQRDKRSLTQVIPASAAMKVNQGRFWPNVRRVFGPVLVGVVGGGLFTLSVGALAMQTLLNNCGAAYAKFPSLTRHWLMVDGSLPEGVIHAGIALGMVAFFGMGLFTVLLVRPRNCWEDIGAGWTTALTATLATLPTMGWAMVLALAVVPSLNDLMLFGKATHHPPEAEPGRPAASKPVHPTDVLVEAYPDLTEALPNERGERFFAKIVADQVVGSAFGLWFGLILSLASSGVLAFCSTLSAGYLLRRGDRLYAVWFPYLELSMPLSSLICCLILMPLALIPGMEGAPWNSLLMAVAPLALLTLFTWVAVPYRWNWLLRITLYAGYYVFFWDKNHQLWLIKVIVAVALALILWQQFVNLKHRLAWGKN